MGLDSAKTHYGAGLNLQNFTTNLGYDDSYLIRIKMGILLDPV